MKKQVVTYDRNPITSLCVSGTLRYLQGELNKLIEKYGEEAVLHVNSGYTNIDEEISFLREETDEEYQERLAYEEQQKQERETAAAKRERYERAEYERLHKKYGEPK